MNRPRYPEYKSSGVEWLGEVPGHWEVKRLKWTIVGCFNGIWGDDADAGDDDILCVRVADFDREGFRVELTEPTIRSVTNRERRNRLLQQGDLLLEKSGGGELQPVGAVVQYQLDNPAVCSNFVARLAVHEDHDSRFLAYFHSHLYQGRVNFRSIKQTTGIQNLDSDAYLSELIGLPPAKEQRAIAAFLDCETARIDALIGKKRRFIELLQEKRAALISRAVTRGLDPKVPLKDSGVEWLGQIPTHWEVGNLRRFSLMRTGHTPSRGEPAYWEGCDISWFTLADVWQLRDGRQIYLGETKEHISRVGLANSAAELLPAGTVIFSRTASIGFSGIMPMQMATTQDFWNWIPGSKLIPEYLLYLFRTMQQEFEKLTMGSTHKTIYQPDAARLHICVPPIAEQQAIVDYVESGTTQIDALVTKVETAIEKLKEYRAALIAAVVTGKIDVRAA